MALSVALFVLCHNCCKVLPRAGGEGCVIYMLLRGLHAPARLLEA